MKKKVIAIANSNFTSLGNSTVHDITAPEYHEYRKCWIKNPAEFIVRDFPMHLDIEVTNRCNLKCTFCDKLPLLSKDQMGDMDLALFQKILDEGGEKGLWGVKLSYRGEPLLHKNIVEMVRYAKNKGVLDVYFNSNGMLLTEDMSNRLIDAGLDRISISVEGIDPEAFELARRGAKFNQILRNVENLINLREKLGCKSPKVRIQTVRLPDLDLESYRSFWSSRCDEVAAIDYKDVHNREKTLTASSWACPQLWQRMTIEWDGTIMPCNNDDYRHLSPGSVRNKTVESCWHDPIVVNARKLHQEGNSHLVKACNGCPWRTTQIMKSNAE